MKRSALVLAAVVVTFAMGFLAHAQVGEPKVPSALPPAPATILSGSDLGFRIESWRAGAPIGTFVVKIDGKWVAVTESLGVKRLTSR